MLSFLPRFSFLEAVARVLAIALVFCATQASAQGHFLNNKPFKNYIFVSETQMEAPEGGNYSICIEFEKTALAVGYTVNGYILAPNKCEAPSAFLGAIKRDSIGEVLTPEKIAAFKAQGIMDPDLPDVPKLPIGERIKARALQVLLVVIAIAVAAFWVVMKLRHSEPKRRYNAPISHAPIMPAARDVPPAPEMPTAAIRPTKSGGLEIEDSVWWIGAIGLPDKPLTFSLTKPALELNDAAEQLEARYPQGLEIEPAYFPKRFDASYKIAPTKRTAHNGHRLPCFFNHNFFFVAHEALEVFKQFDLGDAQFEPVEFYESDGVECIDEPVRVLFPGNPQKAFNLSASPATHGSIVPRSPAINAKGRFLDDAIAVSREVLNGPDIWVDPLYNRTFFISGQLAKALVDAGLDAPFKLRRARIVD